MKTPPDFSSTLLLSTDGHLLAEGSVTLEGGVPAVARYLRDRPEFRPAGITANGRVIPWEDLSPADQATIHETKAAMMQVYHHDERLRFKIGRPSSLKVVRLLRLAERAGISVDQLIEELRIRVQAAQ